MKLLKSSFAAVIAIIAVSFTIAAYAGAFEAKKNAMPPQTCDPTVYKVADPLLFAEFDCDPLAPICGTVQELYAPIVSYAQFECPTSQTPVFCCALLNENVSIVCNEIRKYQVQTLICGDKQPPEGK